MEVGDRNGLNCGKWRVRRNVGRKGNRVGSCRTRLKRRRRGIRKLMVGWERVGGRGRLRKV